MYEVIMPKLGLTMESGKIEKWHKKEGDKVKAGEVLFEVMTDKVTIEVESYDSGILRKILRAEGEEVPVTEVVAYIGERDEKIPKTEPDKTTDGKSKEMEVKETGEVTGKTGEVSSISEGRVKISPLARKTAKELGIDYNSEKIIGTGPGGRISREDVVAYFKKREKAPEKKTAPAPADITIKSSKPLEGIRKVVAERMSYSKLNIPHIVLNVKAGATQLITLREKLKEKILEKYGIKITYTDFILKSTAIALRENLEVNSTFSNGNYIIYDNVNVGMAVSLEG
ncbi:MAG: hypothetical protein COT09_03505, partial [Candidatus Hydromicrobium americanum]